MNDVVRRSLWLLAISTAVVLVSLVFGQDGSTRGPAGDAGTAMTVHAVRVDSEADFITGMIPHHREAVENARQVLESTERPEMQELAQAVIEVQTAEIAELEGWLGAWYPEAEPDLSYQPMMRDLTGMSPDEADRAFLEGMILHHDMAIAMAQSYLAGDFEKRPEVVAMAQEIVSVQDDENAQMRAWLGEWYGVDAGHGDH